MAQWVVARGRLYSDFVALTEIPRLPIHEAQDEQTQSADKEENPGENMSVLTASKHRNLLWKKRPFF
jgi:hypothetical protein